MKDPATGIAFAPKKNGLELFGVGVRKKGPIKIYSVAMYGSEKLKQTLGGLSHSSNHEAALRALQDGAKADNTTFLLEMNFKVGAEKMASAIAESVAPRGGGKNDLESLKSLVFDGCADGGAVKGTRFQFDCNGKAVCVSVNGKRQGTVSSSAISSAFCDVYLDDKCVSPALRSSILENCCKP
jgi:hypothetical protein